MKYLREKNKKKFILYKKNELNYLILKSFIFSTDVAVKTKLNIFQNRWFSLGKFMSFTKIKNRCVFTNSSASITRKFRLHRMPLRLYASYGYINGLNKSSW